MQSAGGQTRRHGQRWVFLLLPLTSWFTTFNKGVRGFLSCAPPFRVVFNATPPGVTRARDAVLKRGGNRALAGGSGPYVVLYGGHDHVARTRSFFFRGSSLENLPDEGGFECARCCACKRERHTETMRRKRGWKFLPLFARVRKYAGRVRERISHKRRRGFSFRGIRFPGR